MAEIATSDDKSLAQISFDAFKKKLKDEREKEILLQKRIEQAIIDYENKMLQQKNIKQTLSDDEEYAQDLLNNRFNYAKYPDRFFDGVISKICRICWHYTSNQFIYDIYLDLILLESVKTGEGDPPSELVNILCERMFNKVRRYYDAASKVSPDMRDILLNIPDAFLEGMLAQKSLDNNTFYVLHFLKLENIPDRGNSTTTSTLPGSCKIDWKNMKNYKTLRDSPLKKPIVTLIYDLISQTFQEKSEKLKSLTSYSDYDDEYSGDNICKIIIMNPDVKMAIDRGLLSRYFIHGMILQKLVDTNSEFELVTTDSNGLSAFIGCKKLGIKGFKIREPDITPAPDITPTPATTSATTPATTSAITPAITPATTPATTSAQVPRSFPKKISLFRRFIKFITKKKRT
jgi:hypothetical protein